MRRDCGLPTAARSALFLDTKPFMSYAVVPTIVVAMVIVSQAGNATANDGSSSPISTDRPAITDSSVVVPSGSFQAENGLSDVSTDGRRTFDGPETLLRFGIASRTELRLTVPDYFSPSGGFGDLVIGVKQQLGPTPGAFDISLVASVSLPSGAHGISSGGYDPFVQLPWSRALSANWTVAGMFSAYWPTEQGRRNVTGETTALIDRQLTKALDTFVEYAGDFPERGMTRHLIHFGTTFKATPHQQLDLHVGVGLSSPAMNHFIGVGYSFRLQAIHHSVTPPPASARRAVIPPA